MADTWRTKFDAAIADSRRTQGRHKAETCWTRFGGVADNVWRRGHSALKATQGRHEDTWRTQGGQAPGTRPGHAAASLFSAAGQPFSGKKRY